MQQSLAFLTAIAFCLYACIQFTEQTSEGVSTDPNQVAFYLYPNNDDNNDKDLLVYNNLASITASRYNASKSLIIYTSGFLQNLTSDPAIKNAYLKVGTASTANIIVVDWGALSGNQAPPPYIPSLALLAAVPLYKDAALNVYIVATRIQQFISFLESNGLLPGGPASIHLVGQSLGAQVMGMVGKYYKTASEKPIGRITGTEPAYPYFGQLTTDDGHLAASDATFVDILHTNRGEAGWPLPIGKVDFFINGGGPLQPECQQPSNLTNLFCSHNLAVAFYAKSILDTGLTLSAYSCDWPSNLICLLLRFGPPTQFGEYCPPTAPMGSYYLNISSTY